MNHKVEALKLHGLGLLKDPRAQVLLGKNKDIPCNIDNPRLVNDFTIGADPEFLMWNKELSRIEPAKSYSLDLYHAYGCDGASTIVELRIFPSRFAARVVASILNTLRFMAFDKKDTAKFDWYSGPSRAGLPLGGHLHLGCKNQANRTGELMGLLQTFHLLIAAGLYNPVDVETRRSLGYGSVTGPGAWREQPTHGWEWRVLPSWLMSPASAHLAITLAKIAQKDWKVWAATKFTKDNGRDFVTNVLGAYRFLDDDCAIAYRGLKHVFENLDGDFKVRWGIQLTSEPLPTDYQVPKLVEPDRQAVEEVVAAIGTGVAPSYRIPKPNWGLAPVTAVAAPPIDGTRFKMAVENCALYGVSGYRFYYDLVTPRTTGYSIELTGGGTLYLPPSLITILGPKVVSKLHKDLKHMRLDGVGVSRHPTGICFPTAFYEQESRIDRIKDLICEVLPICRIPQANVEFSWKWEKAIKKVRDLIT